MSCTKCDLHKDCNKSGMKGRGSKAKYMLVLDIPTKSDNKAGFSPSGDVFLKIKYLLNKAKINESDVYITNAIKCFTPDLTKIKKVHYEACNEHLLNEIVNYNPKAIIACGKIAWQMISGHTSVGEYVGHVEDSSFDVVNDDDSISTVNKKIFPAYSINASLFDWTLHHDILLAFSKAKKYVEHNQIDKCPDPNVKTILSMDDLKLAKEEILSYKWCATDFETTGLQFWKDKIINSGYCGELGKVFVFYHNPYMKSHIDDWNSEQIELGKEINRFLKYHKGDVENTLREIHGSHIKWVLHNSKFDLKFAKRFNIPYKNLFFDTLVADSLIDENMGHSLNECYVRRGINYGAYDTELYRYVGKKSLKTYQYVPPQTLIKYLGYDCEGVYRMVKIMQQQLKEIDMYEHFIKVKMPSIEILLDMEYRGVKYDKPLLLEASNLIKKKIDEQKELLLKITKNPEFNPNSDKQIIDFITTNKYPVKRLGLTLTKKGKLSVNSENLKKFIGTKYEEFPKTILNIKKLVKLKGTYIDGKEGEGGMLQYLDSNNMLHANYNIWTAVTGRYSCNKPSLQTFPRPIKGLPNTRTFIIPSEKDWILFEADFTALEQYIVAILAKDDVLIQKILDGTDIHSFNAVTLGKALGWIEKNITYETFVDNVGKGKIKEEDIPKDVYQLYSDLRTKSKTVGFGLNYGKGAESFAEEFGITVAEAETMIDAYFYLYKKIALWRKRTIEKAQNKGEIELLSGRKRRFTLATDWINSPFAKKSWSARIIKEEIARQAMNYPVQGNAHEAFEQGVLRLVGERFKKEGLQARLLLSIHDGIVGECPPHEKEIVAKCIKEEMVALYNEGTPHELWLKIDVGYYKDRWYGEKIK